MFCRLAAEGVRSVWQRFRLVSERLAATEFRFVMSFEASQVAIPQNHRTSVHVGGATRAHLHQLTRWVLRTARLRAPVTQPMKGAPREGRGTSCAVLRSAPEVRKPRIR